jgi:hypothetical protein
LDALAQSRHFALQKNSESFRHWTNVKSVTDLRFKAPESRVIEIGEAQKAASDLGGPSALPKSSCTRAALPARKI